MWIDSPHHTKFNYQLERSGYFHLHLIRVNIFDYHSYSILDCLSTNSTNRSIVHTLMPQIFPKCRQSSRLIIPAPFLSVFPLTSLPPSTSSHSTPTSLFPASLQNSTVASVCPLRSLTPPSRARSGNTCPGLRKESMPHEAEARLLHVRARSYVDIPVVVPTASREMVYAVPSVSVA